MKLLKFLFAITLVFAINIVSAQKQYLLTTSGKLVPYGQVKTLTTTDSNLTIIDTIKVANNSAGMIELTVVGTDSVGNGITAKEIYRYRKSAGTITLASKADISAKSVDAGLGTSTYSFTTTSYNNLKLAVKGKLVGYTVKWKTILLQTTIP